jgi:hypothetical protein
MYQQNSAVRARNAFSKSNIQKNVCVAPYDPGAVGKQIAMFFVAQAELLEVIDALQTELEVTALHPESAARSGKRRGEHLNGP